MKYLSSIHLPRIDYKKLALWAVALASILLIVSSYLAYTRLYLTPERRFWNAINNNLALPSVVRTVEQGGTGNKSIDTTRFTFGAQAVQDKVSSVSFKNATAESNVTTETLSTPTTQYVRYKNIFSTEKKSDGTDYHFDSIKDIWAKQDEATDASGADNQRLSYLQPLITLAPFGNLTPEARQSIVAELKDGSYVIDFAHPAYQNNNGQKYVTYDVKVQTKKYVKALQDYFTAAGFGSFPPLDPSGYADSSTVSAKFTIELKTNAIVGIQYNDQKELYSDFGVTKPVLIPTSTIPLNELQGRLQAVQ